MGSAEESRIKKLWWDVIVPHWVLCAMTALGAALLGFLPSARQYLRLLAEAAIEPVQLPRIARDAIIAVLVIVLLRRARKFLASFAKPPFPHVAYRQDMFGSIIWRWSYSGDGWPLQLRPFCPGCQTRLVYNTRREFGDHKTDYVCDRCNVLIETFRGTQPEVIDKIQRLIEREVNSGDWKRKVPQKGHT